MAIFYINLWQISYCLFENKKINEKEAEDAPYLKKQKVEKWSSFVCVFLSQNKVLNDAADCSRMSGATFSLLLHTLSAFAAVKTFTFQLFFVLYHTKDRSFIVILAANSETHGGQSYKVSTITLVELNPKPRINRLVGRPVQETFVFFTVANEDFIDIFAL